jgi:hypothetical protein
MSELLFTRPEILMQPQLVKPLHSMAPRNIMGTTWWNKVRQEAYAKNNYHCFACGVHKTKARFKQWLEAHESYAVDFDLKQYKLEELLALCHSCHNYIHAGRLQAIYRTIHEHGDTLLFINDLDKKKAWWTDEKIFPQLFPEIDGTWNKWHLLLNGQKYYSRFKDYKEWAEYYGHKLEE